MVVAIPAVLYAVPGNAYGASEFLLKNTADKKYGDFASCLKSNKNLFTQCIEELKHYITAENKYIRVKKTDDSKNRLRKVVRYIKQSTDIYIQKAEESNDPIDYRKANTAASLLTKLSSAYESEYAPFLKKASARAKGSGVSIKLSKYFSKIGKNEPDLKVVDTLVGNAGPVYDSIDNKLRTSLDKFFAAFVDRYYDHLVRINRSIESNAFPQMSKFEYRHTAYLKVIEITQVDSRSADIGDVKQQIADTMSRHFDELGSQSASLNDRFVSGDRLAAEEVNSQIEYITYFFDMAPIISAHRHSAFIKVTEFPQKILDDLESHRSFYGQSLTAQQSADNHRYSESLNQRYALLGDAYEERLTTESVRRVNRDAGSAVEHYQQIVKKDSLKALALLLALPTKHFTSETEEKRIAALDEFVVVVFKEVDEHVQDDDYPTAFGVLKKAEEISGYLGSYHSNHQEKQIDVLDEFVTGAFKQVDGHVVNGDYTKAFDVLTKAKQYVLTKSEKIPGYFESYHGEHQKKQLAVLDDYADSLFRKVSDLIKNDDYDEVFRHLQYAEQVSGYLTRYQTEHDKVIANARKAADQYWTGRIVEIAKSESLSAAVFVINGKMFADDQKQVATKNLVRLVDKKFKHFSKVMGFASLNNSLRGLQSTAGGGSSQTATKLGELIGRVYEEWIPTEVKSKQLVSAARLIFDAGNNLSDRRRNTLIEEVLENIDKESKNDPKGGIEVLTAMAGIPELPAEYKTDVNELKEKRVEELRLRTDLLDAYGMYKLISYCYEKREGYLIVFINDIELDKAKKQVKAIEKTITSKIELDTDEVWEELMKDWDTLKLLVDADTAGSNPDWDACDPFLFLLENLATSYGIKSGSDKKDF